MTAVRLDLGELQLGKGQTLMLPIISFLTGVKATEPRTSAAG